ncbi:MAG: SDR family oxidoreductase [Candidatus Thermoplasmatota archaeon]|nr:SDR family oxidoreductase [Candidatus Thermoplasmatota archaeon]
MSGLLDGKVAIVTGGSKGIGYSIAERFLKEGAKVIICSRNKAELSKAASKLGCDFHQLDVSDSSGVKSMSEWFSKEHGNLDILVNNAGLIRPGRITNITEEDWDLQINVNLKGPYLMSNNFLPHMSNGGAILNISSTVGLRAMKGAAAYCASKGGVVNLTRAMALDLAGKIRVNCICPAVVDTPMVDERVQAGSVSRRFLEKVQPIGRMGKPAEIASMALHLCGPEAEWTTGSIITIDGGQTAA